VKTSASSSPAKGNKGIFMGFPKGFEIRG